jgi:hypothetical protein
MVMGGERSRGDRSGKRRKARGGKDQNSWAQRFAGAIGDGPGHKIGLVWLDGLTEGR